MRPNRLTITLLLSVLACTVFGQGFHPPVTNFSPRDYGKDHTPENWAITQDFRGVIYSGGGNGVLEYDGNSWDFINVKSGAYAVSLATDSSGTVFVGSIGDIGYLAPDATGEMVFHSLLDEMKEEDQFFTIVWRTWATKDRVFFQSEEQLIVYDYNSVRVVYPEEQFHTSFIVDQELYVRDKGVGLKRYEDDGLELVPNSDTLAGFGVFGLFSVDGSTGNEALLAITQQNGLWEIYADTVIQLFSPDSVEIREAMVFNSLKLSSGNIALATSYAGVLIIDRKGNILKRLNKKSGLRVNDVKDIFEDKDNNLWLALNNGISKVNYNSPLSFFSEESGLIGGVQAVYRYKGKIYVGTSSGLFSESDDPNSFREFAQNEVIKWQVWGFEELNGQLLIGTSEGLYRLANGRLIEVLDKNVNAVRYIEDHDLLVTAGADGLFFLNGNLNLIESVEAPTARAMGIGITSQPVYGDLEFWIGNLAGVVFRVNLVDGQFVFDQFDDMDGLTPGQWIKPINLGDSLVFGTNAGLLRFVDEFEVREGLPDSLKDDPAMMRGYFDALPLNGVTYQEPINLIAGSPERTWVSLDFQIIYIDHEKNDTIIRHPFWGINYGRINSFYLEDNGVLWIGAADGLIRYRENPAKDYGRSFNALIRKVLVNKDSVMFAGAYYRPTDGWNVVSMDQPDALIPALEYANNSIRFQFAAPYFEDNHQVMFSYKLEGNDDEWSEWSYKPEANYTNLKEGDYVFKVKAKNIYEQESDIATYAFTIHPPWYRTTWAYVVYVLLGLLLIFVAVRIGMYRLKKKNEYLERVVEERTQEIKEKNQVLEHQRDEILHQKTEITDSINYAKRIQDAILPIDEEIQKNLKDTFVLFKPKDIVSGDFYWYARVGDNNVLVCADCTGHGVPGAFMSMIGSDKLNQTVKERRITDPSKILAEVNRGIKKALKQGGEGTTRDGMDVAIININYTTGKLQYAGAHRPLWIVRNAELEEVRATKVAVGGFTDDDQEFELHELDINPGDQYYMCSDGYADQFGGEKGKKLKVKVMKKLILEVKDEPMQDQGAYLESKLDQWMGDFEQLDDVCVIGLRL